MIENYRTGLLWKLFMNAQSETRFSKIGLSLRNTILRND
jgi:hypothetical protein